MIQVTTTRLSVGKFYPVSPRVVWDIITDTSQWPRWGPTVKNVQLSERFIRSGPRGQILTSLGFWLPFVIDEYEHAGFWSWKVATIKATWHRFQEKENGLSNLWFGIPMLAAPYAVVCRSALGRIENLLCK